jgi:hypothetical protein
MCAGARIRPAHNVERPVGRVQLLGGALQELDAGAVGAAQVAARRALRPPVPAVLARLGQVEGREVGAHGGHVGPVVLGVWAGREMRGEGLL